jgi:hypothetical protein
MSTRHIHGSHSSTSGDDSGAQLSQELQAYYEAIHSYPDRFAKTGESFQKHLLHVMDVEAQGLRNTGRENLKSA